VSVSVFTAPDGRSLRNSFQLLSALTGRELRLRYQGSIFGWAWSLLRPLALAAILSFALGRVLRTDITGVFLIVGLFPWFWFQSAVGMSTTTFVGNGGLLKKVRFPRAILPLSVVFGNTLQFLLALPVMAAFVIGSGNTPSWEWAIALPMLFIIQLGLITGVSLFVASVTAFVRDLEHIVEVLLTLLFYATPIIYSAALIPSGYRWITWVNPLAPLMEGWRGVLLDNNFPDAHLMAAAAMAAVSLVIGWFTFRALEDSFADVV
jgi:lipopolysaccharide transport system permease protein